MRKILLFFSLISASFTYAQSSKVEDELKVLIADEKYTKCADKAFKYMEKKHKDDPVVYIYASMACLKISQNTELREEFPKAFKDALKYAAKYRKKDENGSVYYQYISHFEEMKKIIAEEVENYLLEDEKAKLFKSYKNSAGLVDKISAMDPNDRGVLLLLGALEIGAQNASEGKTIIKDVLPELKKIKATKVEMPVIKEEPEGEEDDKKKKSKEKERAPLKSFEEMTEMEQVYLRMGLITYANYLFDKNKPDEAKELMEIGKPFFYSENDLFNGEYTTRFKAVYDRINE
jgi:hypothetical protein